jgi:hypothetical protein
MDPSEYTKKYITGSSSNLIFRENNSNLCLTECNRFSLYLSKNSYRGKDNESTIC